MHFGMTREQVAERFGLISPDGRTIDQSTLGRWEKGVSPVKVQDLSVLAEIYETSPLNLFFDPRDETTADLMNRVIRVIEGKDRSAIEDWISLGEKLPKKE